jgi:hypothetical protein
LASWMLNHEGLCCSCSSLPTMEWNSNGNLQPPTPHTHLAWPSAAENWCCASAVATPVGDVVGRCIGLRPQLVKVQRRSHTHVLFGSLSQCSSVSVMSGLAQACSSPW